MLGQRDKCIKVAGENLEQGKSVAIGTCDTTSSGYPLKMCYLTSISSDNTNADVEVRSKWVELAAKYSVPIRCVLFTASPELCEHNDVVRALNTSVSDPYLPTNFQLISTSVDACINGT